MSFFGKKSDKPVVVTVADGNPVEVPPKGRVAKRYFVGVSKLFMFTVSLLWILLFLTASVAMYDQVYDPVLRLYFRNNLNKLTSSGLFVVQVLDAFYIATVVLIGIYCALKAFRFVGKWEPRDSKDGKDSEETNG